MNIICTYHYDEQYYNTGSDWEYSRLKKVIVGKEIPIHDETFLDYIGVALIHSFEYSDIHRDYCKINFTIISMNEKYLEKQCCIRGPMFNDNHIQLIIFFYR